MPTITSLQVQKRNPERVNIFVDGTFVCGVSAAIVLARGLSIGLQLSEADRTALAEDDELDRAYGSALNFLSYRPRSSQEVRDFFRRKGVDGEVAQSVLRRLQDNGLVNDTDFARFWVENRQVFQPRGSRALRMELRRKGVDTDVIDDALVDLGDESEAAYAAGAAKARSYRGLAATEFQQKMIAFLQRRGFPYREAAAVARRLSEEAQLEPMEFRPEEIEGD